MKDVKEMTIAEIINAGVDKERLYNIINRAYEAKDTAEKDKIKAERKAAREEVKKAYSKYMEILTGESMTEKELAGFDKDVLDAIESEWDRNEEIKNRADKITKTKGMTQGEFVNLIREILGEV